MSSVWKTMLKGLAAVLPVLVTLYIIYWVASTLELLVGGFLKFFFLGSIYFQGMGIITGIIILYLAGLLMERSGTIQKLSDFIDRQFERIPLVKSLYGALRDLMRFFSPEKGEVQETKKVVIVTVGANTRAIGLVTGHVAHKISDSLNDEDIVPVYMPMSYQVGGFTVYVPHSQITPIDMSVEEAMKIVLTGGIGET